MPEALIPEEMGFAEFAARLIEETFAAIVASGLDQQEALDRLAATAALDAAAYARAHLGADEIDAELARLFGDGAVRDGAAYQPASATVAEKPAFAALLGVTLERADYTAGRTETTLKATAVRKLRDAAGARLAETRLAALRGALRLGAPRLVVDAGSIKARLVFRIVRLADADKPEVKERLAAPLKPLSAIAGIDAGALSALRFTVRQASDRAPQSSQLSADVFGEVELRFKTVT